MPCLLCCWACCSEHGLTSGCTHYRWGAPMLCRDLHTRLCILAIIAVFTVDKFKHGYQENKTSIVTIPVGQDLHEFPSVPIHQVDPKYNRRCIRKSKNRTMSEKTVKNNLQAFQLFQELQSLLLVHCHPVELA